MNRKARTKKMRRHLLLAFAAAVALGLAYHAAQQWPASAQAAVETPMQAAAAECVFVNHVRRGPGHPYRQEPGEKCRYEFDPAAPDQGGPTRY
jgi:hypothetical protein